MDALLQLMSCFLNAIMYMILIYYFLPFKLQFKEITILFTILSTNMFLINKVGNYGVIFLLISVSIYLMFIRKNRFINIMSFVISYLFIVIFDQFFSLLWNVFVCPISTLLKNTILYFICNFSYCCTSYNMPFYRKILSFIDKKNRSICKQTIICSDRI